MSVSILNHVLGPIMRGPSSSHSAGALRIGRVARDLMNGHLDHVEVIYDPNGSLVTTHASQGSDLGLCGGLMGWEADDERLLDYWGHLDAAGITLKITYASYDAEHANTYKMILRSGDETREMIAVSLGGGMIEVWGIEGVSMRLSGGSYVLIDAENGGIVEESVEPLDPSAYPGRDLRLLRPVIPVLDRDDALPFSNCEEMVAHGEANGLSLPELALAYESARSGMGEAEIRLHLGRVLTVMKDAVSTGLAGTEYDDRILPCQVGNFQKQRKSGRMIGGNGLQDVIETVTAILEAKSAMAPIVAAPTAGSCGVLPGTLLGVARSLDVTDDALVDALLAAGMIGTFIAKGATFSAEEGGCMAECGSASGMVAAGLVTLRRGTLDEAIGAACMALQNSFGMICDPIGNRVEAPCLGKNTMAATNAMSCVNMALAGYEHLVPFDQVIVAMDEVGRALPRELCCTGLGGLATTPAAQEIEKRMAAKSCSRCVTP